MNRILSITSLTILALTAPLLAGPMTYSGTKSADFIDPVGGQSSGAGTNVLQFGGHNGSKLEWYVNPQFSTTEGVPFKLGEVFLSNGSPINSPSQVTVAVHLDFAVPALAGNDTFQFQAGISTTGRDGVGSFSVNFDSGGKSTVTGGDGTKYTLELLGLSNSWDWGGHTTSTLTADSCNSSNAYVWGKLTSDPPQVPEPSALLLGLIGIGTIGLIRWRNKLSMSRMALSGV